MHLLIIFPSLFGHNITVHISWLLHSTELAFPFFKRYEATTTALLRLKLFICLPVRLIENLARSGVCKAKKTAGTAIL